MGALAVAAIPAAISAIGRICGGKTQSRGATQAANIRAGGVSEAARLGAASQAEQLKYLKNQALIARSDAGVDRRANYLSSEAFEQNLHNRLAASIQNTYAGDLAGSQTNVGMFNAAAQNARSRFKAGRDDQNMLRTLQDARIGELGEMIGIGGRDPLSFNQLKALERAKAFDPGPPIIPTHVKTPYVPPYDPTNPVNV